MEKFELNESFGYHLNFITTNIKRYMDNELKKFDITVMQFGILINLYKKNVNTQKELIKFINGDEASITRLVDRLEAKNLLNRVPDKNDKRKKQLQLTADGTKLIETLIPLAMMGNEKLVEDLSEEETKEFLRLLQKVTNSVENLFNS